MPAKTRNLEHRHCKAVRMKGTSSLYLVSTNIALVNFRVISLSLIRALPVLFLEWSVDEVKSWVLDVFGRSELAKNFEDEEIDGRILLSSMLRTDEAMEKLGLNTLGKKGKFLQKTAELAGMAIPSYIFGDVSVS